MKSLLSGPVSCVLILIFFFEENGLAEIEEGDNLACDDDAHKALCALKVTFFDKCRSY